MAKLVHVSAKEPVEVKVSSMTHVRVNNDQTISLSMPYWSEGESKGTHLVLSKQEALELAARLTNVVALFI